MTKEEILDLCKSYQLDVNEQSTSGNIPAFAIRNYDNATSMSEASRTTDMPLAEIIQMYFTALANGATFEQVDASALDVYGVHFVQLYAVLILIAVAP